ncbi:hypothetical protein C8A05DRAFT_13260 [Staphylotrichum tortipilum]|uniref:Hydrophobin 3 n=1 Tax=Staphylotrichum tortipilum TaxID=2831512 RepID=A0AAN6RWC5_9PEZI|nr:hypothetical protein C8A05DRAFT_13260 [Staphylotrichum longicolle]
MQFSSLFTLLAVAMTASAVPSGHGGGSAEINACSSKTANVCCGGLLGCVITLVGKECEGSSYCCDTTAPQGGVIDVNALNCVKLL